MKEILVVVDMQKDFVEGALGTPEAQKIVPAVVKRIENFSGDVFYTCDTHEQDYLDTEEGKHLPVPHCIRDTEGWRLIPAVEALRKSAPVCKNTFGSVKLGQLLQEMDRQTPIGSITLIGLCTDVCVISNALLLKAFLPHVSIRVDSSCCAGVTPESHETALRAMPCLSGGNTVG